jgi:hypothetical protein
MLVGEMGGFGGATRIRDKVDPRRPAGSPSAPGGRAAGLGGQDVVFIRDPWPDVPVPGRKGRGRPEAARLQSGAHSAMWLVTAGLSAVFIVVGLLLLGSFVRNFP